ncbi:MAG: HAD-IC family P-type ATPase [Myxococcota bacterium]
MSASGAHERPWHALGIDEACAALATSDAGLSPESVAQRRAEYGANRLEEAPPTTAWALLLHQFHSPLIYILLVAAAVTVAIGEYIDAAVIAAVLAINAAIGFFQEQRAEQSVRALMRLVSPKAHVSRGGQEAEIDSAELVPGDVVLLESGARVPADLRLFRCNDLAIDESLLTGESLPVRKSEVAVPEETAVADRLSMTHAGSIVTAGRGRGWVVAIGRNTELGSIAQSMRSAEIVATPMQERMRRFAQVVAAVVIAASALAIAVGLLHGLRLSELFLVAVTLAVSAIPEGLPVVVTITLAIGVRRMAGRNAVIRRLPAVETLGSTTVVGSDKTGTLTENRMTVMEAVTPVGGVTLHDGFESPPLSEPLRSLALAGVLANEADIAPGQGDQEKVRGDPTEGALLVAARRLGLDFRAERTAHESLYEIPFEPERAYSASVRAKDARRWIFVKGAPERILDMCVNAAGEGRGTLPLDPLEVQRHGSVLAGRGLRLLAFARRELEPEEDAARTRLAGLTFLGLTGMMDPPREGVRESITACRDAGIRVLMITGDHAQTARAIGRDLGLGDGADPVVMTGAEFALLDDAARERAAAETQVFARVAPEQKLAVVHALQRRGEVVAVTGDGVNDAPAIRAADIGVAMGRSGTDVAREAADMVLTDDNFVSIVAAVEEGRITFDNLRKVTFFLISTGAAEIVTILTALALDWPLPFLPAQILWLNLVTNGVQDVALAFEPGDPDVLKHAPRSRSEGIVSRLLWERTLVAGFTMAAGTLCVFHWELGEAGSVARAQTVALTTMVLFQVFHVGNSRSEHQSVFTRSPFSNRFLLLATVAALSVHVAALFLVPIQLVLRVEAIAEPATWLRMIAVASTILLTMELHKWLRRP